MRVKRDQYVLARRFVDLPKTGICRPGKQLRVTQVIRCIDRVSKAVDPGPDITT
jgi:hypothetical protein